MTDNTDRVRRSTADDVNAELDGQRVADVARFASAPPDEITQRLRELDKEWDIERVLEANAATLALVGQLLSPRSRLWRAVTVIVPAFLLQHAIQGWCPPIAIFRRLGIRTRREIDAERTALKALRGDFTGVTPYGTSARTAAEGALRAAGTR